MKLQSYLKKIDTEMVLTCVLLIIVGYMVIKLFTIKYEGLSGRCECADTSQGDDVCYDGTHTRNKTFCTDQTTEATCKTSGGRSNFIPEGNCKWIPDPAQPPHDPAQPPHDPAQPPHDPAQPPHDPAQPPIAETSYNCISNVCTEALGSGTTGTYSSLSECQTNCGNGTGNGNSDPDLFKLEYSTSDSGLFTSVYNCASATANDTDKITCPDDKKTLDTDAKTASKIGGTLFSWLFGKPAKATAQSKCCTTTS